MNHFELKEGELFCEGVALADIAAAVGTPVYVYSTATLERHYTVLRDALVDQGLGDGRQGDVLTVKLAVPKLEVVHRGLA